MNSATTSLTRSAWSEVDLAVGVTAARHVPGIVDDAAERGIPAMLVLSPGLCDQGPALLVNHRHVVTRLDAERVARIAELVDAGTSVPDWPAQWYRVVDNVRRADALLGTPLAPGAALAAARARGAPALVDEIKASNLRGRGGAGYVTGRKWELCRDAPGDARYVVCNADEGEPGTLKDRVLLTPQPDLLFEGMTIAALAIGARHGLVYLRGEYRYLLDPLQAVLARRREAGLLGQSILGVAGADFDIEIHLGAGAYVCGEESALIESLEGKRGTPRNRPPFPVTNGYLRVARRQDEDPFRHQGPEGLVDLPGIAHGPGDGDVEAGQEDVPPFQLAQRGVHPGLCGVVRRRGTPG